MRRLLAWFWRKAARSAALEVATWSEFRRFRQEVDERVQRIEALEGRLSHLEGRVTRVEAGGRYL